MCFVILLSFCVSGNSYLHFMDWDLWSPSSDIVSYDGDYSEILKWHCDYFGRGGGCDEIEEDALNAESCVQVLRILITKADTEIDELEKDLLCLQNELAWTENENWPEICCSALTERINQLDVAVTALKSDHADDTEVQLLLHSKPAETLDEIVKALHQDHCQDTHVQRLDENILNPIVNVTDHAPDNDSNNTDANVIIREGGEEDFGTSENSRSSELLPGLHEKRSDDPKKSKELLAISLVRSPDLGVVSCVPYHSDRMILSDTLDDKVTEDEDVGQNQLITTDTCQILIPFLSKEENTTLKEDVCSDGYKFSTIKGNKLQTTESDQILNPFLLKGNESIPNETKEENITVIEDFCSDDHRLAITKGSQLIATETGQILNQFLPKENENIRSEAKEESTTLIENVCSDECRLAIVKGSITAESGQILDPFLSKENKNIPSKTKAKTLFPSNRNKNIPSETKEDNTNLQGNECSDDYRLAIIKGSVTAESGQILHPFLSKENKSIPSETKEVNIAVKENVCSDDQRLSFIKGSQLIAKSAGQILNPIWSKRNRNIPSETKEDNTNLQGNVCSDDYRLAIFKEIKMHSHSRFGTSQQEESENFDLTKKLCDFIPKTARRGCRKESKVAPDEDLESMRNFVPKTAQRACKKEPVVAPDEDLESMDAPLQVVFPQNLCFSDTESSAIKKNNVNNALQVLDLKAEVAAKFSKSYKRQGKKKPEFEACSARESLNSPAEVIPSASKSVSTKRQRKPKTCTAGTINEPMDSKIAERAVKPGKHEIDDNVVDLDDSDYTPTKRQRKPKTCTADKILNEPMNSKISKRALKPGKHEIGGSNIVLYDNDYASSKRQRKPETHTAGMIFKEPMNSKIINWTVQPGQHETVGNAVVLYDNEFSELQEKGQDSELSITSEVQNSIVNYFDTTNMDRVPLDVMPHALVDSHNDSSAMLPVYTTETLMEKALPELKSMAREHKILKYYKLKKADLIEQLVERLSSC
ncbi:uncharacterized protein LOC127126361 isoform X2 [Lathyrus oleraceus]|uniref:Rho termination factor-like N-terminal domain-containing protein n=1 Tax=Pisum sativum TaxID=3888 RepID=A0A9D4XUI4_PEA|nr:uncharacterized protein LOC127126361 isoform X2 [Pisum sativum]KAI5427142.1 hypothetical protein KIW84_032531 [Pisum sativum]